MKKFRAQVEILSSKDIEKMVKRLSKEELDIFIEIMEGYNVEMNERLVSARYALQQELKNNKILLKNVWTIIPDSLREHLADDFNSMSKLV